MGMFTGKKGGPLSALGASPTSLLSGGASSPGAMPGEDPSSPTPSASPVGGAGAPDAVGSAHVSKDQIRQILSGSKSMADAVEQLCGLVNGAESQEDASEEAGEGPENTEMGTGAPGASGAASMGVMTPPAKPKSPLGL